MFVSLWNWLKKLFGARPHAGMRHPTWPTTEKIEQMPWFDEIPDENIVLVATKEGARRAHEEIMAAGVVGFDTESKPTFVKGEKSTGPHIAQFATPTCAYIFQLHEPECRRVVCALIKSPELKKVGFGLSGDVRMINNKLKVHPQNLLDIETLFVAKGHGRGVGVKVGVALVFKKRFRKSRRASTSNWAAHHLNEQQIRYAANDAYAAIKVYLKLAK